MNKKSRSKSSKNEFREKNNTKTGIRFIKGSVVVILIWLLILFVTDTNEESNVGQKTAEELVAEANGLWTLESNFDDLSRDTKIRLQELMQLDPILRGDAIQSIFKITDRMEELDDQRLAEVDQIRITTSTIQFALDHGTDQGESSRATLNAMIEKCLTSNDLDLQQTAHYARLSSVVHDYVRNDDEQAVSKAIEYTNDSFRQFKDDPKWVTKILPIIRLLQSKHGSENAGKDLTTLIVSKLLGSSDLKIQSVGLVVNGDIVFKNFNRELANDQIRNGDRKGWNRINAAISTLTEHPDVSFAHYKRVIELIESNSVEMQLNDVDLELGAIQIAARRLSVPSERKKVERYFDSFNNRLQLVGTKLKMNAKLTDGTSLSDSQIVNPVLVAFLNFEKSDAAMDVIRSVKQYQLRKSELDFDVVIVPLDFPSLNQIEALNKLVNFHIVRPGTNVFESFGFEIIDAPYMVLTDSTQAIRFIGVSTRDVLNPKSKAWGSLRN